MHFLNLLKSVMFSFSCCLDQYKLVSLKSTERFQSIAACWAACSDVGMGLMQLHSDIERFIIVNLPDYNPWKIVMTDGIEVLDKSGHAMFFSSPGGKQIDFIRLASTIGKRQSKTPGKYSIVIYHTQYYSRDSVVDTHDQCACSLWSKGERRLYTYHADFEAERVLARYQAVLPALANAHWEHVFSMLFFVLGHCYEKWRLLQLSLFLRHTHRRSRG